MGAKMVIPGVYEFKPDLEDGRGDLEKHERLLKVSGIPPEHIAGCRFSTFEMIQGRQEGFEAACKFVRGEINPPLLLMYGEPGRSKTHLAASIAISFVAQLKSVVYYYVGDLLDDLRAGIRIDRALAPLKYDSRSAAIIIQKCKSWSLLVLDDLGLGDETEWAWGKLDTIVNHRFDYRLPTVITANTLDISERIRDRCRQGLVVRLTGESYREIIARRKAKNGTGTS